MKRSPLNIARGRQTSRLLGLALVLLWHAGSALAQACGPYKVGLYEFGTLLYRDEKEQLTGIDKDVLDALVRRSGCVLETRLESRARIWDQLQRGQLDMTVSGIATAERLQYADFLPYLVARNHALMRREQAQAAGANFSSFLADPSLRAVAVRGFRYGSQIDGWLSQLRAQGRVDEVSDFPIALRVLAAGRVALLFAHPLVLDPWWHTNWAAKFELLDWAPQDSVQASLVLVRQRVRPADRELLAKHLEAMLRDGEMDRILRKYLSPEMWRRSRLGGPGG
ncbi:MAG: substrate-binding periplasmic protein [Roseateles sp.]